MAVWTGVPVSRSKTVKVEGAGVVGMPEIVPEALIERPAGSWPVVMLQAYGVEPPIAARVCEYGVPVVAGLRVGVVMMSGLSTVKARDCVEV